MASLLVETARVINRYDYKSPRPLTITLCEKGSAPKVFSLTCPQLYDVLYGHCSISKVCPSCLRVWAVLRHQGDAKAFPCAESCIECNQPFLGCQVPGSLLRDSALSDFDHELLARLPYELLVREFQLLLKVLT